MMVGRKGSAMGGQGSGKWFRHRKKATVEASLGISVRDFLPRNRASNSGTITWSWLNGHTSGLRYTIHQDAVDRRVSLRYCSHRGENVHVSIRMESTPTQFGGKRWWLVCPLSLDGVPCRRRVSALYRPPGASYFGCRTCYRLTYKSVQQAHKEERLTGRLASIPRRVTDT